MYSYFYKTVFFAYENLWNLKKERIELDGDISGA